MPYTNATCRAVAALGVAAAPCMESVYPNAAMACCGFTDKRLDPLRERGYRIGPWQSREPRCVVQPPLDSGT